MRKLILASMIFVPLIPFLLILYIGYYYFTVSIENSTINHMKRIVADHRQMIDSFLAERKADLQLICDLYDFDMIVKQQNLQKAFDNLQKGSNMFVDLGIFDHNGFHVAYYGPYKLSGIEYGQTEWFKNVKEKGVFISDIFLGYRKSPHFIIAVTQNEGDKTWILRATIDIDMFNNLVKSVRTGKTGEAYILNSQGLFQTERRSGGSLMSRDEDEFTDFSYHDGIRTFIYKNNLGIKFLYATTWLKNGKWLLVVRQQKDDAFMNLRYASYLILIVSIIGVSFITGVAFYMTSKIVRKMEQTDDEKERLNEQLIRASRLAELGEMSAGFAHEINNPLQIMKNEHTLIKEIFLELKERGELRESESLNDLEDSLMQIQSQIERCANITQSVLKFGRKTDYVETEINMKKVIDDVVKMIEKKANVHGIIINKNFHDDTMEIKGHQGQMQQIFLNLFNNAIDAIIERHGSSGGIIKINTGYDGNGNVEITVKDNGCGVEPENLERIFSPFFTTKPVGKGTGLGLAVCYGIIHDMGGTMSVESDVGKGTTFSIKLPFPK